MYGKPFTFSQGAKWLGLQNARTSEWGTVILCHRIIPTFYAQSGMSQFRTHFLKGVNVKDIILHRDVHSYYKLNKLFKA